MLRRLLPLAVAGLVAISGTAALAQSEDDVERAAAEIDAATAEIASAATAQASTTDRLLGAIFTYETTTRSIEAASFDLADAETAILDSERRLNELGDKVATLAAELYMLGADRGAFINSDASTLAAIGLEHAFADIEAEVTAIDTLRSDLETDRDAADSLRWTLTQARDSHARAIDMINTLLDVVEVRQTVAASRKVTAEAAYEVAVADLEKARKGITPKVEAWGDVVARYFPQDQYWNALQVMACESRGTPTALNPTSDAAGLFQFLPGTWLISSKGAGFEGADPYDPEANIASAAWLVQRSIDWDHPRGAWGHWSCQPSS